MDQKNPYNIYYMSSIQIDKISGRIFFRYPANPVSGRIVKITILCTPTKFYLAHGIVVVRAFYAQNTNFKLAWVFEFLSNF